MSRFPVQYFTTGEALVGYDDFYKSAFLNKKFAGYPKGVYVGFTPSAVGNTVTLAPDSAEGCSVAHGPSDVDPGGTTVVVSDPVVMDLSTIDASDYPVQVVLRMSYSDDAASAAAIITRSTATAAFDEVVICEVDGPPGVLSIRDDASLGERDEPLAFDGVTFGFMPSDSMENLEDASTIVNEIVAARVGLDGVTYDSLSDSLAATQSAEQMAQRLGLALVVLRSNEYTLTAGEGSLNVSGSFSETSRSFEPKVSLGGLGSDTPGAEAEGALSGPNDIVRNVAIVKDQADGFRLMDSELTRNIIFGRITGPEETTLSGEFTFTNAVSTVIVSAGATDGEFEVGDLILGADGVYYEVETIVDDTTIRLTSAYAGATATIGNVISRRWTLELKYFSDDGEELAASTDFATVVSFYFPAFLRVDQSNIDYSMIQLAEGGRRPLPRASTAIPGKTTLAESDSRVGAIKIQNGGTPLSSGALFHTINFTSGGGQVVQSSAGVLRVGEIGPKGPTGPDGGAGATGPEGPAGAGYSEIAPKNDKGPFDGGPTSTRASPDSWTESVNVGHTIRALAIQMNGWVEEGGWHPSYDIWYFDSGSITGVGTSTAGFTAKVSQDYILYGVLISTAGD